MTTVRWISWALVVALFLAASTVHGQPLWDARQLVAAKGASGSTTLRAEGREVATVDNARVALLVDIVDRMGPQFGVRPKVFLTPGTAPNAFATRNKEGDAVVAFNPAMLDLIGRDADMTAVVVGHELAHLELKHVDESQSRRAAINLIALIAGAALGYNVGKRGVDPTAVLELSAFGGTLVNRKFDRDQERAADELGMKALHAAGYDVYAGPRVWETMARATSGGSGWWTSTHPSHSERIDTLSKMAVALKPNGASASTMVARATLTPPSGATQNEVPGDGYALSGDDGWCLMWARSGDCRFKDIESCRARGTDCRSRTALNEGPTRSAASESSATVPVTLQPVACLLSDGSTETLPRVQCAARGGTPN